MSYLKKIKTSEILSGDFAGGIGEGANIRTPCGARRIELVRPGDLIVTRDNGLQPVRLIWSREIRKVEFTANPAAAPIHLNPRAVGPMMPSQDITVAPDHRILVPGYRLQGQEDTTSCLVAAAQLARSSDAAYADTSARVNRFYTLVFDSPQVFACDGLPVESFQAGAKQIAQLKANLRGELVALFPQLKHEPNSYPPINYKPVTQAQFVA